LHRSRKYSYPPQERLTEIRRGERGGWGSKAQYLKEKYDTKVEFPEGVGGFKLQNLSWEAYGYFLEQHILAWCHLQVKFVVGRHSKSFSQSYPVFFPQEETNISKQKFKSG